MHNIPYNWLIHMFQRLRLVEQGDFGVQIKLIRRTVDECTYQIAKMGHGLIRESHSL